jgi:hypothetical protein
MATKTIAAVAKPASATLLMPVAPLMPVPTGRLRTIDDLEWATQRAPWFDNRGQGRRRSPRSTIGQGPSGPRAP